MIDDFDIIALNGITGDCLTTEGEEATQEPELSPEQIEAIRQQHEPFLTQLEALAVQAIAKGFWDDVYDHINFNAPETEEA
jgi:hypothetical protein